MKMISLKLSIFSVLFVGFCFVTTSSYAANPNKDSSMQSPRPSQAAARLEKGKLRSCEARKEAIITRSERLTNLATTMQEKFDIIALRVQNYYTTTVVPEGKSVPNYDTLTAEIQTKKALVTSSLADAQTNLSEFSCESGNAKASVQQFNEDMRMVKGALKEYRTAIKNLIVAVRGNDL